MSKLACFVATGMEVGPHVSFGCTSTNVEACNLLRDPQALAVNDWRAQRRVGSALRVRTHDNPRICLGTLYKPTAKTTNIDFLEFMDGSTVSFAIRSAVQASIQLVAANPTMKSVTPTGFFRLVMFEPGVKARAVGPTFPVPVTMVFKQWTQ